jgi:4-amino-4-deoxy-L-arabinose transferase-like glycosyltransferase
MVWFDTWRPWRNPGTIMEQCLPALCWKGNNMSLQRRDYLIMLIVFALAFGIRLMFSWSILNNEYGFAMGDDAQYYGIAMSLLEDGQFAYEGEPTAYRLPVFPMFLASLSAVFGTQPYSIWPVLIGISSATCVLVYVLGLLIFNWRVGLFAASACVFEPNLLLYSSFYLTETLFIFLFCSSMLVVEFLRRTYDQRLALLAGLLLATLVMTRTHGAPIAFMVVCWLLYLGRNNLRRAIPAVLVISITIGLPWSLWIVRNYLVFDTLVPFTTQAGNGYNGIYSDQAADLTRGWKFGRWTNPDILAGLNEIEADHAYHARAREWQKEHPGLAVVVALAQAFQFWRPDYYAISLIFLAPLTILSVIFYWKRWPPSMVLWLLLMLGLTLVAVITIAVGRFSLPLYPLMAILAADTILTLRAHLLQRHRKPAREASMLPDAPVGSPQKEA